MDSWSAETVVSVPAKKVEGWALPEMPGKEYESQYIDYAEWFRKDGA